MSKHQNHDYKPAFGNSEANIGGAHLILSDYVSFHKRVGGTGPSREILLTKKQAPHTMAQRLSHNRAVRRAAVDTTAINHVNAVYHLNRRIEDMYTSTERRKNPHDATTFPSYQSRPSSGRPGLHTQLVEPWAAGIGYSSTALSPGVGPQPPTGPLTRPTTAPARGGRRRSGDHYQGWSLTPSLRHTFPADDFPVTRMFGTSRPPTDYGVYKSAIMAEVVGSRLYREPDLKRLFKTYLKLAPLHDKQVVEQVVADLKVELDVR